MSRLFTLPRAVPIVSGAVSPGCKANFFLTGTTTRTNTFTDSALGTPSTNPVIANAAGEFATIYLDPDVIYKLTLDDTDDALIYTEDPIQDALTQSNIGKIFYPRSAEEISAGVTPINFFEIYRNVLRYGTNTTPGTTVMTTALTNAFLSYNTVDILEDILIDADFTVGANQTLRGGGMRTITLTLSGVGTTLFIEDRSIIQDIKITGADTNTKVVATAPTAARWRLSNVHINGGVSGLVLENTWIGLIDNCYLTGNTNGLHLSNSLGADGPVNAITVLGGEIQSNVIGVLIDDSGNGSYGINAFDFFGATIEGNSTGGVRVTGTSVQTIQFNGCYFEKNNDYIYKQEVGCLLVKFNSCFLDLGGETGDRGIWVTAGISDCMTLTSNEFDVGSPGNSTKAVDFEVGATIREPIFIGNSWESGLTITNSTTIPIRAIADRLLGTRIVIPAVENLREIVTTTNVITAEETGKTFFLSTAGGFTSTLPAPAAGLNYKFIVRVAPTTAYIITTNGGSNILHGTFLDIVGELTVIVAQDTLNFVASTALKGDRLEVESDGSVWYCKAISGADGGITVSA